MAIISATSPLHGANGLIGGLILRTYSGKTVASMYRQPDRKKAKRKETELQKLYRARFTEATKYAKEITRDAKAYEYYKRKAIKLGLNNAYTAAIADFLRKGSIEKIDTSKFERKGQIIVKAHKKDMDFTNVKLRISTRDGKVLAETTGKRNTNGTWHFHYPGKPPRLSDVTLHIEAQDRVGHSIHKEAA